MKLSAQTWNPIGPTQQYLLTQIPSVSIVDNIGNIYASNQSLNNYYGKNFIAKWDGTKWNNIGSLDTLGLANCFAVDNNNNLYVGGFYHIVSGNKYYYVAKWDGANWSELGNLNNLNVSYGITSIAVDKIGNIYATGGIRNSSNQYCVAKWDGNNWSELGKNANPLNFGGFITKLTIDSLNNIYIAGFFYNASSKLYIAKFNGITWSELGSNMGIATNGSINSIHIDRYNNLYVGGSFKNSSGKYFIAKWDGSAWSQISTNNNSVTGLTSDSSGSIYCIGGFKTTTGSIVRYHLAKYDGLVWSYLPDSLRNLDVTNSDAISYLYNAKNSIYINGNFVNKDGIPFIARWNGVNWSEVNGTNQLTTYNDITDFCYDKAGNVYVCQNSKVEKWDGYNWKNIIPADEVLNFRGATTIESDSIGNIYVLAKKGSGGDLYSSFWDGDKWQYRNLAITSILTPKLYKDKKGRLYVINNSTQYYASLIPVIGNTYPGREVLAVAFDTANVMYFGGAATDDSGYLYIQKYDSANGIQKLNGRINKYLKGGGVYTIAIDNKNNIYCAGNFINGNIKCYVVKWDGSQWNEVVGTNSFNVSAPIQALLTDTLGNLYATGDFTNSKGYKYVAKWDGNSWSEVLGADSTSNVLGSASIKLDAAYKLMSVRKDFISYQYIAAFNCVSTAKEIFGKVITPLNKIIQNASIKYYGAAKGNTSSDFLGVYKFKMNSANYTIRPTKNNDITKANGVTSVDVLLTQRHILNTTKLNSPYKLIAADVDGNKVINSVDVLRMKRLILGTDTTFTKTVVTTKTDRLWEFVDSGYAFPDTTNPFPFKDSISFTNLTSNKINQTFIGVKLGDVNYDWNATVARQMPVNSVQLIYDVISTKEKSTQTDFSGTNLRNDELRIPITTNNFKDLAAMQYTLHFDNTKYEFVGIENNKLGIDFNAPPANKTGNIAMLWTDKNAQSTTLADGNELFTLVLRAKELGIGNLELGINTDISEVEAWDNDYRKHNIILTQKVINKKTQTKNELVIYPNPTNGIVNIECENAKQVVIVDAMGRSIKQLTVNNEKFIVDTKQFTKGIFIVKVTMKDGTIKSEKLVVE
ncbi:unnamed protein product [Rotaria sp. Silwood1]|nr:unnamed protein product [Rotaria sp. Silwood1]